MDTDRDKPLTINHRPSPKGYGGTSQPSLHYHLIGVGGVGMSALAQALVYEGHSVSGSDRDYDSGKPLEIFSQLSDAGVSLFPQDGSGVTDAVSSVVYSSAIEDDNPDLCAAKAKNIREDHRADALASLLEGKRCVAIAGTSGKSTVTGMIGWILEQLGADPCVVNGAPVVNWREAGVIGNARKGGSDLWIVEADESDRSLLKFSPDWAVITNVSEDHFGLAETEELFHEFSDRVRQGLVSALDEKDLFDDFNPLLSASGVSFSYNDVDFRLSVCGRHNAENALVAVMMCEMLGYDLKAVSEALSLFKGIHRRLEVAGTVGGVTVVDDYAHNPAKISAALQTVQPFSRRILSVWRPHGFGPLKSMLDGLADVFASVRGEQDRVYVLPVYDAGGTADRSVSPEDLVEKLKGRGCFAEAVSGYDEIVSKLSVEAGEGDTVLVMGARDPELPMLAKKILSALC